MQVWTVVGIAVVVVAAWIAWIRQATVAARLRIWLDPQYRDGKHVARRSGGRHAAAGPEASGVPGLIAHRRALHIRKLARRRSTATRRSGSTCRPVRPRIRRQPSWTPTG